LRGLVAELAEQRGLKVDYRSVWAFVHAEGLSFKKKRAARRTATAKDREASRAMEEYQGRLDPRRLVFIDETWAKTNMASLRGWAPSASASMPRCPMAIGGR